MLVEESRFKMIEKQKDPQMTEKKVITKPINYAILNQLSTDFETRFVPQIKLSAEQAFWSQYSVQTNESNLSATTTIVKVPKELPKVSMVNSCLKKLKSHLASFDMVVKERTTATAIIEGTWGFEQTKACFRDDIILFVKALKELFTSFDQYLIDEVTEVQHKNTLSSSESAPTFAEFFEINDLKAQAQAKDTVILQLKEKLRFLKVAENEHLKQTYKQLYDSIKSLRVRSKEQCDDLINKVNLKSAKVSDLNASLQEKVLVITALKEQINKLKGKAVLTKAVSLNPIDPELLRVDVAPLVPKLHKNRTTHIDYIRHTLDEAATLRKIVESERLLSPLNTSLDYALKMKVWKPTGNMFKTVGHIWQPTGQTFKLVGNVCPLTRIATPTIVPPREPIPIVKSMDKPVVTLIYTKKPKAANKKVPNKLEPNNSWGSSSSNVPSSLLTCRLSKSSSGTWTPIMGYGDYQIGNVTISRVYYVEGLGHNLFSVGQFCDSDLEVAFRQHTCFIRNLDGVDMLTGSRGNNLYTLSLQDMIASSLICLLSEASKTKSWLWHRRLSHLNFGAINHLARHGLVRGLPKLKFEKDHLCSACAMGKSTKKTHKPKSEDTNQEKLYLLHMDLCGLMRVKSVNGKKYILVIVDDYSRFTWVKFLHSKDETPMFIIKFLKMIQVRLNVPVRRIRTDNGTKFVNQTLRDYYEEVGISHETLVARSPQQNGVAERRNHTLIEAARTMLIYAQAPLFLWAEAVATACFTQNRSIIRLRHRKTPYELLHSKLPDLSFFHVFGALCYPTNDSENLGKLQPKADIEIFIGYAPTKKAFRIYNRHTRRIVKTIHVDFDELTAMVSEQSSSGSALNDMTLGTISSGLVRPSSSSTSFIPPSRNDWDLLFQPMFDELLNPPSSVVNQAVEVIAHIVEVIPQVDADSTSSPSSTIVDQDAPSPSKYLTPTEIQSSIILQDVGNDNLDMEVAHMGNDPLLGVPFLENKARLVARGYRQEEGIDFEESFALVARLE
nr:retrovirus-related Pol polyprotein from transposon TNT 1-94 [Tanacetum cinerariifolium]